MRSSEFADGPIMIVVYVCLAVAMSFISFGLGLVNLAKDTSGPPARPQVSQQEQQSTDQARHEVQALRHELEQLSTEIARRKAASTAGEKSEAQDRLSALQSQSAEMARQIADLEGRVADLQKNLVGKTNSVKEAEFQLADGRLQLAEAGETIEQLKQSIEDKKKFDVLHLGGSMRHPQDIECVKDDIIIQPQNERISVKSIKGSNSHFVDAVRNREVLFLVRPSGFESFDAALGAARNLGATVGYEPVDEDWPLKFHPQPGGGNSAPPHGR